jgi:hypothetical protein
MANSNERASSKTLGATPKEREDSRKSWAQEHGGLIFLILVVSVISFAVLFDSCMQ